MKTSTIKMIAIFAAVSLLSVNVTLAKDHGGNKGGNGGNHSGGFKISFGGPTKSLFNNNINHKDCHDGHCYPNYSNYNNQRYCNQSYGQTYGQAYGQNYGQAFEPFHSTYTVLPGDSFYEVSLREYGTSGAATYIARFNRLATNAALVPGQRLMLPSVSSNGAMRASRAPAGDSIYSPQGPITQQFATNSFAPVTTSFSKPVVEAARPKVTVGSTLLVDGQTFGEKQGAARLRVSGLSLPIEVIEWTTSSVKIRLPQVELTSSTKADIEVLRADGTLASKTAVELGAATEQVALSK